MRTGPNAKLNPIWKEPHFVTTAITYILAMNLDKDQNGLILMGRGSRNSIFVAIGGHRPHTSPDVAGFRLVQDRRVRRAE